MFAVELTQGTGIGGGLIAAIVRTVAIVVVYFGKGYLRSRRYAFECGRIKARVVAQLADLDTPARPQDQVGIIDKLDCYGLMYLPNTKSTRSMQGQSDTSTDEIESHQRSRALIMMTDKARSPVLYISYALKSIIVDVVAVLLVARSSILAGSLIKE